MLHQLRRAAPEIDFRAVNDRASCRYMKMITPEALLRSLREGTDEVHVDPELAARGRARGAADDRHRPAGRWGVSERASAASSTASVAQRAERRRGSDVSASPGRPPRTSSSSAAASPASPPRSTRPRPGCGSSSSPRTPRTPAPPAGRRAASRSSSVTSLATASAPHVADTLTAGAGLCDAAAVASILADGPAAVARLRARGAVFDTTPAGGLERTREGGHSAFRVVRAGGDATGAEIERALVARRARPRAAADRPRRRRRAARTGRPGAGAVAGSRCSTTLGRPGLLRAPAVLLATGGYGQLFASTTNPATATGDGVALALRAGATAADLEFVQFHPTVLWLPGGHGQRPLVTEAVRGEGGVLRDRAGARFMVGVHPLADLAPRDVVAAAITRRMAETGTDVRVARRHGRRRVRRPLPDRDGVLPGRRDRPGPRADPGDAGRALRVRRRRHRRRRAHDGARALRRRRGGAHGPARREPAGVELAAGGPRRGCPGGPGGGRRPRRAPPGGRAASPRRRCSPRRTGARCSGR